ncbi:MAG: hypothetical protein ABI383_05650 [Acidobacteriaceae bacterium]
MSEQRRVAVILVRHDNSPAPSLADCRDLFLTGDSSLARYFDDNTERWFDFAAFDFFGWYDVILAAPPDARGNLRDAAKAAASNAGVNLGQYDSFIVVASPGKAQGPNPALANDPAALPAMVLRGYDAGADGIGPGHSAVLVAFESRTFFCHEFAHVLGFNHTYGLLNHGIDWAGTGVTGFPYGDPYDLMSSASFGDANPAPTFNLPATEAKAGFPGALSAGPMLSRAQLHFFFPLALETAGKVRHVTQGSEGALFALSHAGSGEAGAAELVVYHPANEDSAAHGRVYIEYRHHFEQFSDPLSKWDQALSSSGDSRIRGGVIVHTVKDLSDGSGTAVWYAGRIVFPSADCDVNVETDHGTVCVTVSDASIHESPPVHVTCRITSTLAAKRVSIATSIADDVKTTVLEQRSIPGWDFAGKFDWVRTATARTEVYTPTSAGLGGDGSPDKASVVNVYWYLENYMFTGNSGAMSILPPGGLRAVKVKYEIVPETGVLTLTSDPADGAYVLRVTASASDSSNRNNPITAVSTFEAPGSTEDWGGDYKRFMDLIQSITHPKPKQKFGPVHPGDMREIERMRAEVQALGQSNPQAAQVLHPMLNEMERVNLGAVRKLAATGGSR